MSYDPYDEEMETLLNDILKAYESLPNRAKKIMLIDLFDRIASLKTILENKGTVLSEEDLHFELTSKFDKIQVLRVSEAKRFLSELMKKELP